MSLSLNIHPPHIDCSIQIGENLLLEGLKFCHEIADQVVCVTVDSLVPYLPSTLHPLILPSGEKVKQRPFKEQIEDHLFQRGCTSKSCLMGIGGGALLDLAGYTASTYCRGISYISFPTTLLAMCDAAIGGKTGVNLGSAKNYLGSFYFPKKIYLDIKWLEILPENEFVNGIAETIKHGLIGDHTLFEFLEENWQRIMNREKTIIHEMIRASVEVKLKIVQKDPFEQLGLRRILNFGHTVAHALESESQYSLSHGEAVAMGMLIEGAMGVRMGIFDKVHFERLQELILKFPFHLSFPKNLPFESMKKDKKGGTVFIPIKRIGEIVPFPGYVAMFTEKTFEQGWKDALCLVEKRNACRY